MDRGFYTLGSGMLTQSRLLATVGNNIANADTNGFKKARQAEKTFGSMLLERVNRARTPIGTASLMDTADKTVTDFSEGTLTRTGRPLDFAIAGDGFFAVRGDAGTVYTRNGSFNVDEDGYLVLKGQGRVLGSDGVPLRPGTDSLTADRQGNLFVQDAVVGRIGVFRFPDNAALQSAGEGMYRGNGGRAVENPSVFWESLEGSNVDMTEEMTRALASERQLQSCSNAMNLYDETLDQAVEISKV